MKLSELTAYAAQKYDIHEDTERTEYTGSSVLSHPVTGKCIALLIREKTAGGEIQLCDLRCGSRILSCGKGNFLSPPHRMKGNEWIGVRFDDDTDQKTVFRLFDRAFIFSGKYGSLIVLGSELAGQQPDYTDTPLPFHEDAPRPAKKHIPEKLREMRRLYEYGSGSFRLMCRNFYVQGKFMEDYEDDAPWSGVFRQYFPTYHDLTLEQLRGYFTWRTAVRRGVFTETSTSFAYIYIYELLNGIGAASPEDSLKKLEEFEKGYIDSGIGEASIRNYLHKWMTDLAVVSGQPPEVTYRYAGSDMMKKDRAYAVLKEPKEYSDDEVFDALFTFGRKKTLSSPVLIKYPAEGQHLFASVWRYAAANYRENGKRLFALCFGGLRSSIWHPFSNAVCCPDFGKADRIYELNKHHIFIYKNGEWHEKSYRGSDSGKTRFEGLLHETDRRLRISLKEGSPLKENPEDSWAAEMIEAVINADRAEKEKLSARKVTIRFDDLERIRRDALHTRDSLLTEDETEERPPAPAPAPEIPAAAPDAAEKHEAAAPLPSVPVLSERQAQIIDMLIHGQPVKDILRSWGEMAEIFAEQLNEALFDELGDTAVECDGDNITIIEDYREDIIRISGGDT